MPLPAEDKPNVTDLEKALVTLSEQAPEGGLLLDLGCGQNRLDGFIGIDSHPADDQTMLGDVSCDVYIADSKGLVPNNPLSGKLADNSVSMIYSSHFMEHVYKDEWQHLWKDLYRICKPGAIVVTVFPYGNSVGAFQDPTHQQFLFPETFLYFDRDWRREVSMDHGYLADVHFKMIVAPWYAWDEDFVGASDHAKEYAIKHTFNAVREAVIFMKCIK